MANPNPKAVFLFGLSIDATIPTSSIGLVTKMEIRQFLFVASIFFIMDKTFLNPNAFWIWFRVKDLLVVCDGKAFSISLSGANFLNGPI